MFLTAAIGAAIGAVAGGLIAGRKMIADNATQAMDNAAQVVGLLRDRTSCFRIHETIRKPFCHRFSGLFLQSLYQISLMLSK